MQESFDLADLAFATDEAAQLNGQVVRPRGAAAVASIARWWRSVRGRVEWPRSQDRHNHPEGLSPQRAAAKLAVTVRVGPPFHEGGSPGQVSPPGPGASAPAGPLTAAVAVNGSRGVARA